MIKLFLGLTMVAIWLWMKFVAPEGIGIIPEFILFATASGFLIWWIAGRVRKND